MKKLQIGNWSFEKGEKVELYWLRSPCLQGDKKHWHLDVVFRKANGNLKNLSCPWKMLPQLRLGTWYADGKLLTKEPSGRVQQLCFSDTASFSIIEVAKVIDRRQYLSLFHKYLREQCIVATDDYQRRIIIPCIEVARSFFVQSPFLAGALLQPEELADIVHATESNGNVELIFSKRFPVRLLNDKFVAQIAMILCEPNWSEEWKAVSSRRNNVNSRGIIPLECAPPVFHNSTWTVRGVEMGNTLLVMEIIGTSQGAPHPFNQIEYMHPKIKQKGEISGTPGKEVPAKFPQHDGEETVTPADAPSSKSMTSVPIGYLQAVHGYKTDPKIESVKVGKPRNVLDASKLNRFSGRYIGTVDSGNIASLHDAESNGDVPAVEFKGIDNFDELPETFRKIILALDDARGSYFTLETEYSIGSLPSAAQRQGEDNRRYLLATLRHLGKIAYVLELESSSKHVNSTVVFNISSPGKSVDKIVNELLGSCISSYGYWDVDQLDKLDEGIRVELARHTNAKSSDWGERLFEKAFGI